MNGGVAIAGSRGGVSPFRSEVGATFVIVHLA